MTDPQDSWYFIGSDGTEFGPYPRATLRAMRESGQVGSSDLVWSPGMEGWQPYSEVLPPPPPAALAVPEGKAELGTPHSGPQPSVPAPVGSPAVLPPLASSGGDALDTAPHPWRRYFARILDVFLFVILAAIAVGFVAELVVPGGSDAALSVLDNEFIASIVMLAGWIPCEAFALSVFGTTPGRSLLGIVVRGSDGDVLSFDKSLERSVRVVVQGLAAGFPIVVLFTQWFAYRRLTTTGTTLWDDAVGAVVTHRPWTTARTIACTLALALGLTLLGVLASIGAAG